MKFLDEYRDETLAKKILEEIRRLVTKPWVLMEVCGGQTHSIVKYMALTGCRLPGCVGAWCMARVVRFV